MEKWEDIRARVIARDAGCSGRFLGGPCSQTLDVHHIIPRDRGGTDEDDNLMCLCHRHHPMIESLRMAILSKRPPRAIKCRHAHRYPGAREACERRLNRARVAA